MDYCNSILVGLPSVCLCQCCECPIRCRSQNSEPHLADDARTPLASNPASHRLQIRNDDASSRLRHCTRMHPHRNQASYRSVKMQSHTTMCCARNVSRATHTYTIWMMCLLCADPKSIRVFISVAFLNKQLTTLFFNFQL